MIKTWMQFYTFILGAAITLFSMYVFMAPNSNWMEVYNIKVTDNKVIIDSTYYNTFIVERYTNLVNDNGIVICDGYSKGERYPDYIGEVETIQSVLNNSECAKNIPPDKYHFEFDWEFYNYFDRRSIIVDSDDFYVDVPAPPPTIIDSHRKPFVRPPVIVPQVIIPPHYYYRKTPRVNHAFNPFGFLQKLFNQKGKQ